MKIMSLQPKYPTSVEASEECLKYMLDKLNKLDEDVDLVVLPEYANVPGPIASREDLNERSARNTPILLKAASDAAKRLNSFVAVNVACDEGSGMRNTTYLYRGDGSLAYRYFKLHLPYSEKVELALDQSYAFGADGKPDLSGCVAEIDGIRFGFLTCYDMYFNEQIEYMADFQPDIIVYASYQRGERSDILQSQIKLCSMRCNSHVVRSSYSMGLKNGADNGAHSMIASPEGQILCDIGQGTGFITAEIEPKWKYYRSNGFGQPDVLNDMFIREGRLYNFE